MEVRLSGRMEALAGMVSAGNRLADVGTDHAYIPIALCLAGKIPSAIAMDIGEGPLARARDHIAAYGLDDRIGTRRADGLLGLGEGEADTVMIAGMGGLLTVKILTDRALPESVTELVLGPQSEIAEVRRCVRELGFRIVEEKMVCEDGKFYPLMRAERMDPAAGECGTACAAADCGEERMREMEDAFGPVLLAQRDPVLRRWLARELAATDQILAHLEGTSTEHIRLRRQELKHKKELLQDALRLYE